MSWSVFLCLVATAAAFRSPYPKAVEHVMTGTEAGEPLLLSPYIKSGDVKTARDLAIVTELTPNITSYSGFLTVNESCGSNLFFWFFPSQNKPETDPVTVWLQGGPGASSIIGLLTENGPYNLTEELTLEKREHSWNRNSSLIFIDNPVGVGYSFTTGDCYSENQTHVGQNLLNGLEQFFEIFPEYKVNDFYLSGESYGGKYVPGAAYAIYNSKSKINLKGILIGNGLVDPRNQQNYSSYMYQLGLIDSYNRTIMANQEAEVRAAVDRGEYRRASELMNVVLGLATNIPGFTALYNYLYSGYEPRADINPFITQTSVRRALHVGNATWNNGDEVYDRLFVDLSVSQRASIEILLENKYKVLIYNGQLDIICAYPLALDYVKLLKWSGAEEYKSAERKLWKVGSSLAGYSKTGGNFTDVLVRNAGHMVPQNKPEWSLDLYNKFILNQKF